MLDTGAGGGSYISVEMWLSLKRRLGLSIDRSTSGALQAANPSASAIPPMRILGSVPVPVLFTNDSQVRTVVVRVVEALPYDFILGADYFRRNRSVFNFDPARGFQPIPASPWVPFSVEVASRVMEDDELRSHRNRFCALTHGPPKHLDKSDHAHAALSVRPELPSYQDVAWEDTSSLEWNVRLLDRDVAVEGFTSVAAEGAPIGPMPQDRQLVMVVPKRKFDLDDEATLGVARAVMWWTPGTPVYCKLVNRGNLDSAIVGRPVVARMIALNVRDESRFRSLFDESPSVLDPPVPCPDAPSPEPVFVSGAAVDRKVDVRNANLGQLGALQKHQLVNVLSAFIEEGLFPIDPKRVPACIDGELELPLINEFCTPYAAKQRRFSPQEREMIQAEIEKLLERGIIRRSMSPWAAQCLCVRKKDGTLRLCIDWRVLNKQLVSDSGGLGDMQTVFDGLKGKRYFSQLDLASGFHQLEIAEKDRHKTAFRDATGLLYEFTRAGFGLTVLPSAFTRTVKNALGSVKNVYSWLDDILIASDTWEEHLATLVVILKRLQNAGLSVNFAKCIFGAASMEFLGMIIDSSGVYPSPSKLEAIAEMPRPQTVEELRTFLGMTGYLRQFVEDYSVICAPLTDLLRNKLFASKKPRKLPIPWGEDEQLAFTAIRSALASPTVLAFPDPNSPFELHTDASSVGAGAVLMQKVGDTSRVISFASHRFSRTDARRGPTERECMAVLWAVNHFRPYLLGRPFTLVTDCSALTWLFRSRDLCPKLHRWALRLMEHDMTLEWRAGTQHVLPDALSRLPHQPHQGDDIDDSFPDDGSSSQKEQFVGPRGPSLDGVLLSTLEAIAAPTPVPPIAPPSALTALLAFSDADQLPAQEPDAARPREVPEPAPGATAGNLRRSHRRRTPSVRLRQFPPPVQFADPRAQQVNRPTPVDTVVASPPAEEPPLEAAGDVSEVLAAGGDMPRSRAAQQPRPTVPVDRAASILTDPAILVAQQREDSHLSQVRECLDKPGCRTDYCVDEQGIIRFVDSGGKKVIAVPQSMVADVLALVHELHGHVGVGPTLTLVRDCFHWLTLVKDTKQYVLSCGCRRGKKSNSRRVAMMPGRFVEPWDELVIDILAIDTKSDSGNKYVLVVDKATRFPFGFPLPNKQAVGVACKLVELCLTFGVPRMIRCDRGGEFRAEVVTHLCRWLKAEIAFGPTDHPRGQGSAERLGGWLREMLAELCKAWPNRWDEYVSPALWIKRTLPDQSLHAKMTPFELLFGRAPRTSLDSLVPVSEGTDGAAGLNNFVERRKQNLREVRAALERRHDLRISARARADAAIQTTSAGVASKKGGLVLVRETDATRFREGRGRKLQHEIYTGPWTVKEVPLTGLSVVVTMQGRKERTRSVSTADVKRFHLRPPSLRHALPDEFAQYAWGREFKTRIAAADDDSVVTLADCRRIRETSGRKKWEYRGRTQSGKDKGWLSEGQTLKAFTILQLDCFIALWHLYNPGSAPAETDAMTPRPSTPLSREEALKLYPIGTPVRKDFGGGLILDGQVYDYHGPYWRVRYTDNDWEEATRSDIKRICRR